MSNAKSLVSEILGGLRLDGHNNYDQWHRKIKYLLSENDSIEFITQEVKPPASKDDASEMKRYQDETKKDRSARFLMLSCMADDLVHLYEDLPSAKAMWEALSQKYGILSETKLRALELKLTKLKCTSNKGMEKHLLALIACFANMKKAGQPYSDERKRITLLNSLPDTPDWENMHHSGIHKFDSYEKCVAAVELEVECLKERSMSKTQSSANFVQAKPKAKDGKPQGPGKRKADPKEKSGTEGGSFKEEEEEDPLWKET